jgi:hypothetical protein
MSDSDKPRAESREPRAESWEFLPDEPSAESREPSAEFDSWITTVAPTLNAPNAVPREDMWAAIQAARSTSHDAQAGKIPGVTPLRRSPWRLMSLIAAALLLGVALDRMMLSTVETPLATPVAATTAPDSSDPARLYRLAAAQTLTQAEALLTAYRASEPRSEGTQQLGRWGRDILSSTRLLIDSPAGTDPQLRALLNDLELVLVQIIQLSGAPLEAADRELIDKALQDRDLLPRLRTAVPAGDVAAASSASAD